MTLRFFVELFCMHLLVLYYFFKNTYGSLVNLNLFMAFWHLWLKPGYGK